MTVPDLELPPEVFRTAAVTVTMARLVANGALIQDIFAAPEEDGHSWGRAAAYGSLGILDKLDGAIARLHPEAPTASTAALDEQADKAGAYATDIALAIKRGDWFIALCALAEAPRDIAVYYRREQLRAQNLEAKARPLGKLKTGLKFATNAVELSPLGERYPNIPKAMRLGSVVLSWVSGVDFFMAAWQAEQEAATS